MQVNRHRQWIATWIAIFAVLLASLAPSISHVLAAGGWTGYLNDTTLWSEKSDHVAEQAAHAHDMHASHLPAESLPSVDHGLHFEHCPFCFTHAGSFGAPPTVEFVTPLAIGSPVLPLLFFHASHPLFAWAAPQARAPPSFS
jgi:hypothetical protein